MTAVLLLVLTFPGLFVQSLSKFREYHHVKTPKTWAEAQRYCREMYSDLATVENQHENNRLLHAVQKNGELSWIGLYHDLIRWKWTLDDADFNNSDDYSNWKEGQPDNEDYKGGCVVITSQGLWRDEDCESERPVACFYDPGPSKYIIVETPMTWHKAKDYCRSNYTDLATVRNVMENDEIQSMLSRNVWMGLYRNIWSYWSDRSPTTFKSWSDGQPENTRNISCAAVNTDTGMWWDVDCEEEHEFICQNLIPPRSRFTLRFQSEADLMDPYIQQKILEQLQIKLKKIDELTDFKLRWIQTDGQTFHKEQGSEN